MSRILWMVSLLLASVTATAVFGQDTKTNAAGPKIYRDKVVPHWFAGDNRFWYRVELPGDGREFVLVDAAQGTRGAAFDHERLAKALSEKLGTTVKADQLPFDSLRFSEDGKSVRLAGKDAAWQCDLSTYQLTEAKAEETSPAAQDATPRERRRRDRSLQGASAKSPDGKWEAVVRGHNLFLRDLKTEKEEPLSYDANPNDSYARDVERNRYVEMEYEARPPETPEPEVYWSPDSRHLVAMRTQPGTHRLVYLIESSPKDQLQPKLQSYPYLKPGDTVPIRTPHLFDVEAKKEILIDDTLFRNPWSIGDVRWSPGSARFTFLFNQRGHQALRILAVDAGSGAIRPIVDEESKTFIDYSGKFFAEYLDDTGEIIWMSERDGWNHLYLYDAQTGQVKNQITKGEWVVRGVDRVDREKRQLWFRAGGIRSGQDPYYIHYCRVNFDGTGLTILTEGDGTHTVQFSPDRRFLIDTWSRVNLPPVNELRRADDGQRVCKLEEADARELFASGWRAPEPFVAKGRDGVTDIYGVIFRPKEFDPQKKYPVIENIYAGPQDSYVPKAFRAANRQEKLVDLGFIVVQIDGMGTANRSKKFHDVCWKNLGDAGFPDRLLWIKAAAAKYPCMDLSRVGIYGTSAGGQSALGGLLTHGDFYKVGVADSGCHDNRMDKIWWNEQWMGWPVGPEYAAQSNVTLAHNLQGKLLLMVGELDKNVDPASTMQVVNALIKADKDFDLLVMPGAGHGVAGTPYGQRRLREFFVRNLLGTESGGQEGTTAKTAGAIVLLDPPEQGFFSKRLDFHGIPIKAHKVVADEALYVAYDRLALELGHLPMVVSNLVAAGVELHIIGRNQVTTDLPEWRQDKGKPLEEYHGLTRDQRTRGMGGRLTSCGEENLLKLEKDHYRGRDICLHEFAHAIREFGIPPQVRGRFDDQYRRSLEHGRWRKSYAGSNPDEFFAELTMWYFGTHGDLGMTGPKPANGPEGLKHYDPEAFALFDNFYQGRIPITEVGRPKRPRAADTGSTKPAANNPAPNREAR